MTAWSTSPSWAAASASTGSRTCVDLGDEIEVRGRRHRPERQGLALAGRRQRRRGRSRAGATTGAPGTCRSPERSERPERSDRADESRSAAPARDGIATRVVRGRLRRRGAREFGDLGPADVGARPASSRGGGGGRGDGGGAAVATDDAGAAGHGRCPTAASASAAASPTGIRVVTERMPEAHSVTTGFWVGVGVARRAGRARRRVALPRAPAVQGHRQPLGARHRRGGRRGRRRDERLHHGEHTAFYTRLPADDLELGPRPARRRLWRAGVPARRGRRRARGDPRGDPHERGRRPTTSCTTLFTRRCSPSIRSGARCSATRARSRP